MDNAPHIPVLLNEVINGFSSARANGNFVDCTLGYAGHSYEILKKYNTLNLIGIDRDDEALNFSKNKLEPFKDRVTLLKGSFSQRLNDIDFTSLSALLADFGVSSLQLDKQDRGFRFDSQILDMRMDQNSSFSAKELVNTYPQNELERIFKEYGETKEHKRVAKAIVDYRANKTIQSNVELSDIITNIVRKSGKIHPATLYFQAIRIEVNDELEEINKLLDILEEKTPKNAIIGLITFHSLEDRLVKKRFRKWSKKCTCPSGVMRCSCGNNNNLGVELNKKPIIATKEEIKQNPRSRSAKLRLFKFKG
jgi:16S rRNA (cytosine1402-N4)-methyltransferase